MPYKSYQGRVFRSRSFGRLAVAAESQKGKSALPPEMPIGQDGRARLGEVSIVTVLGILKGKPHDIFKPTVSTSSTPVDTHESRMGAPNVHPETNAARPAPPTPRAFGASFQLD
jgi:hypothetical protein